jgi:hypothetical protein
MDSTTQIFVQGVEASARHGKNSYLLIAAISVCVVGLLAVVIAMQVKLRYKPDTSGGLDKTWKRLSSPLLGLAWGLALINLIITITAFVAGGLYLTLGVLSLTLVSFIVTLYGFSRMRGKEAGDPCFDVTPVLLLSFFISLLTAAYVIVQTVKRWDGFSYPLTFFVHDVLAPADAALKFTDKHIQEIGLPRKLVEKVPIMNFVGSGFEELRKDKNRMADSENELRKKLNMFAKGEEVKFDDYFDAEEFTKQAMHEVKSHPGQWLNYASKIKPARLELILKQANLSEEQQDLARLLVGSVGHMHQDKMDRLVTRFLSPGEDIGLSTNVNPMDALKEGLELLQDLPLDAQKKMAAAALTQMNIPIPAENVGKLLDAVHKVSPEAQRGLIDFVASMANGVEPENAVLYNPEIQALFNDPNMHAMFADFMPKAP